MHQLHAGLCHYLMPSAHALEPPASPPSRACILQRCTNTMCALAQKRSFTLLVLAPFGAGKAPVQHIWCRQAPAQSSWCRRGTSTKNQHPNKESVTIYMLLQPGYAGTSYTRTLCLLPARPVRRPLPGSIASGGSTIRLCLGDACSQQELGQPLMVRGVLCFCRASGTCVPSYLDWLVAFDQAMW